MGDYLTIRGGDRTFLVSYLRMTAYCGKRIEKLAAVHCHIKPKLLLKRTKESFPKTDLTKVPLAFAAVLCNLVQKGVAEHGTHRRYQYQIKALQKRIRH